MNSECAVCKQDFKIEPGFYLGAVYISYGFVVAIVIVVGSVLFFTYDDPPVYIYVLAILLVTILLLPAIFRFSRLLFLHWFGGIKYQPTLISKKS